MAPVDPDDQLLQVVLEDLVEQARRRCHVVPFLQLSRPSVQAHRLGLVGQATQMDQLALQGQARQAILVLH